MSLIFYIILELALSSFNSDICVSFKASFVDFQISGIYFKTCYFC